MECEVEGEPLTPENFTKDFGWQHVVSRRSSVRNSAINQIGGNVSGLKPNADSNAMGRADRADLKSKIIRGGRMPPLPKEEAKIVVRPRGGLCISKVGPTVVADAIWDNAACYVGIEGITVTGQRFEVSAYEAAPHSTCKGVIRGVPLSDGPAEIEKKLVNSRNPAALGAKRIKKTTTVVVLFDGYRVPNFVSYGGTMIRCTLFRKQMDVCYSCGRLGHRSDVCPSPNDAVCRGCGEANPDAQHRCYPKCKLCGGGHLTAAKECKRRFQTPYLDPVQVEIPNPIQSQVPIRIQGPFGFQNPASIRTSARLYTWREATVPRLGRFGDFNAPYGLWGYVYDTTKGRNLWQDANEMDLTLVTDKAFPTRIGNSATRDTTPDLAFVKNVEDVGWENTAMEFGSDHYILETHFKVARSRVREFTFVDWDHFRKIREEPGRASAPASLEEWCEGIRNDASAATKKVVTDLDVEQMDSQRLNRRLRKKISELNKVIDDYCKVLCKQQWDELCESIDGQIRNGKSWGMLKHLLDVSGPKSNQKHTLARALHEATWTHTGDELVSKLLQKYLPIRHNGDVVTQLPDYRGPPRPVLDEDFSVAEVRQAIFALNRKSAPGPDGVTNRMLRNLDAPSIAFLTDKINEVWKNGVVPAEWKMACTVLIPKPGKAPNIENLRPISLTSCVGKVMEHVVLNRINRMP
ncbi:uncharacterized protein LOC144172510 [Haemaphysalis longicornis]